MLHARPELLGCVLHVEQHSNRALRPGVSDRRRDRWCAQQMSNIAPRVRGNGAKAASPIRTPTRAQQATNVADDRTVVAIVRVTEQRRIDVGDVDAVHTVDRNNRWRHIAQLADSPDTSWKCQRFVVRRCIQRRALSECAEGLSQQSEIIGVDIGCRQHNLAESRSRIVRDSVAMLLKAFISGQFPRLCAMT